MTRPRLLVANRGEIAVRILRACRDLSIDGVVVFSDADRDSLHVRLADHAVPIGPSPARESYLVAGKLLDAAKKTGATLVHPGFGFLAENAAFAQAVVDAGLTWVGPSPSSIAAMGSKTEARTRMLAAGVPVVPGMTSPARDAAEIVAFGREHGFPLLLKAAAGGGGKGMRVVRSEAEVAPAFARAESEARSFFADGAVYAELYVEAPRHIEVQVLGDGHGRLVALGERECSLQRRHQKVLEECPSAAVGPELRARLEEVAVAAARAVDYRSAGTVEFLLEGGERPGPTPPDARFFFLEMNTRIQVEHPVTELVYGVDLVAAMIRVALGEPLPFDGHPSPRGHAVECRIYAEDPARGFAPSPGLIRRLRWPQGPGIRVDSGVEEGDTVPLEYDPMLAKVIAHASTRDEAIRRMKRALAETRIEGIDTSVPFFLKLLEEPDVLENRVSTQYLDRYVFTPPAPPDALEDLALAAAALDTIDASRRRHASFEPAQPSAWRTARPSFGNRA